MKIKLGRVLKAICFCTLVLLTVSFLTKLFTPKWLENRWQSTKTNNSFYELEDNSIDVAILGSSVVAAAVDPYQLYEEYGISSYNLGVMQQPMMGTYFWLEELLKTQTPKVVVVETKTVGRVSDKDEADARKSYDYMKWGKVKYQYAKEYCEASEETDLFEYLFPLSLYHTRWSEISYDDYDFVWGNDDSYTRGFATLTTKSAIQYSGIKMNSSKTKEYNEENEKYFTKIINLCKTKNIDMVMIRTPDESWSTSKYNHVKSIADEYKIDYLDFNTETLMKSAEINYAEDAADSVHLNILGAKKITSYLGKYLMKDYKLTDYRDGQNSVKKVYESEMNMYKNTYEDAQLCMENNLDNYLNTIKNNEKYSILIGNGISYTGGFTETQKEILKKIGVSDEMFEVSDADESNIIGVFDSKNNIFKKKKITEKNPQLLQEGHLKDETVYSVTSKPGKCSMKIGTTEYAINKYGLNMVVYDNITGRVADNFCLWVNGDGVIVIVR